MHSLTPAMVLETYIKLPGFRKLAGLTCRVGFAENSRGFAKTCSPGSGQLPRPRVRVQRTLCSTDTGC
jgi:hypothetical protein